MAEGTHKPGYLVLCVILCILPFPECVSCQPSTESITTQITPALSWWGARNYCKEENNGDLYVPNLHHQNSVSYPRNGTMYWVGAFEASEWKWRDNSTLFVYIGYAANNGLRMFKVIPGNCVEQCYIHCQHNTYIGLSETRCFCLKESPVSDSTFRGNETLCPGNSGEKCGDSEGMSIYKTDIEFGDSNHGQCVYSYWPYSHRTQHIGLETGNCDETRFAVCSDKDMADFEGKKSCTGNGYQQCTSGICTTCRRYKWRDIRNSANCTQLKVTNKNKDIFVSSFNLFNVSQINAWIGLRRRTTQFWINGNKFIIRSYSRKQNPRCLAIMYRDYMTTLWLPCSEAHQALCATINTMKRTNGSNIGVEVGFGVLMIVVLTIVVVGVVVVLKRKEMFCVQKQPKKGIRAQGTENRTDDAFYHEIELTPVNVVDQATLAENHNNHASKVDKTHLNITTLHHGSGPKETCSTNSDNNVDDEDIYDRAGQFKNVGAEVIENVYNHLKADEENDYDIAGRKPDIAQWDSTYSHVDAVRVDQ